MTIVTTTTSSGPYTAVAQTTFAVTFQSAGDGEIEVTLAGVVQSPSLYTFTRAADGTGSVVFTAAVTGQVLIYSKPNFDQPTAFSRFGAFYPDQINTPLDKAAAKTLYLKNLLVPAASTSPASRANKYLAFDASGNPVVGDAPGATAAAASAAAAAADRVLAQAAAAAAAAASAGAISRTCFIVAWCGQSLTVARGPQITAAINIAPDLLMPNGGGEMPDLNSPVPLSVSSVPVVPTNFASFVPFVSPAGREGLGPGAGYQFHQAGAGKVISFVPGIGGVSLASWLAGGTNYSAGGPFFANFQTYLYHAVKWARANGYTPKIIPIWIQGHADVDLADDGGNALAACTTQPQYLAGLTKLRRDMKIAAMSALGDNWTDPLWVTPLLTAASGSSSYTLLGRRAVVAAELQAALGAVPGVRLLPPHSQFAATFDEGDLVHPRGQGYRYYGELAAAYVLKNLMQPASPISPPYIIAKTVLNGTQVKLTFDQPVQVSGLVAEATTAGVMAGLEAYTTGGISATQLPITAVSVSGNDVTITMANTATFSVVRNGLAQEMTGGFALMPRTRIAGTTNVGTAQDGTVLGNFSIVQEF